MNYDNLTRHPLSSAWGDQSDSEYAALVESIRTQGWIGTNPYLPCRTGRSTTDGTVCSPSGTQARKT